MLIDLHAHTKGISHCCLKDYKYILNNAKENGFQGLAISNHYTSNYYLDETYNEWIEKYIREIEISEEYASKIGLKVFYATELTMEYDTKIHILLYGVTREFLLKYPKLCEKSLEEVYKIAKENNLAVVQAHPFRNGASIQNVNYLDGIEINCHLIYKNSYASDILKNAKTHNLCVTVGCDYHADTKRMLGGTIIPDTIKTDKDLVDYILNSKEFNLQVHEPLTDEIYKITYKRK